MQGYLDFSYGIPPSLDAELSATLDKLLADQDLSPEPLRAWTEGQRQYAAEVHTLVDLEQFGLPGAETSNAPEVKPAEPSKPKTLTLVPLWKSPDVTNPGNLLVISGPGPSGGGVSPAAASAPRLLAIDNLNSVVEVGPDGKRTATHALELPSGEIVTLLRTATDSGGKRYFLAAGAACPHVYLFDENWKRLLSIPALPAADARPPEGEPLQVADAQLADIDGDGKPEILISYFSGGGVQCYSLDGRERWRNQDMKQVPRVAVSRGAGGEPIVLCTNERGRLTVLDALGKRLDEIGPDQAIIWIASADLEGGQKPRVCGIFVVPNSTTRGAVVIGSTGDDKRAHTLPTGLLLGGIEPIVPGRLAADGPGCWLLPAADGSIHILAPDGQLIDQFNSGSVLRGLATFMLEGRPVLVVSSDRGLEAFTVQWPEKVQ